MQNKERYTSVAIALHWIMAIALILMIGSGLSFDFFEMDKNFKFNLYQWHKSLGLILLVTAFARLGWRVFHKPPSLPTSFPKLDIIAAHLGHIALYLCMIIMPIAGWVMVSSSSYGLPTIIFGWFEWPHVPGVAQDKEINNLSSTIHDIGGWVFLAIIAAHIGAVFKHIIVDKYNLLPRMGIGTKTKLTLVFVLFCALASPFATQAKPYNVIKDQSRIEFSAEHAGNAFTGVFETWTADIDFDRADLQNSTAKITFETASATTGNALYDGTLPTADWFDVKNHSTAVFQSQSFTKTKNGFSVTGDLILKNITHPITFDFALSTQSPTIMTAEFPIDRLTYDIGKSSDPEAEWVSREIEISLQVVAAQD